MSIKAFFLIAPISILFSCLKPQKNDERNISKRSEIVFVNIEETNRYEVAKFINEISKNKAAVIGINVLFEDRKDDESDSILALAIANSRKAVLNVLIESDTTPVVKSDNNFRSRQFSEGGSTFLVDASDGIVRSYIPLYQTASEQVISFAHNLALIYRETSNNQITNFGINRVESLDLRYNLDDFIMLEDLTIKKDMVEGKIVILGHFGPSEDDSYLVERNGKIEKMFSSVIEANIILNILDGVQ